MNKKNIITALLVALVIGSILNAINSFNIFINGDFTGSNITRIVLTYITPFCVSLYSSIKAQKQNSIKKPY